MASNNEQEQVHGGSFGKVNVDELHNKLGGQLTEWLKLKTDQLQQRVDLRVDGLEKQLIAKLDSKPGIAAMIINTAVAIGIVVAILAFGGDRFDGGISASGSYAQQNVERERRDAAIDQQLTEIRAQLEAIRNEQQPRR